MVSQGSARLRALVSFAAALLCPAFLAARFGFGLFPESLDAALALLAMVHFGVLLFPDSRSFAERLSEDGWTSIFLGLLLAGLLTVAALVASGSMDQAGGLELAVAFVIVIVVMISARVLLWHLGRLLTSSIPAWAILPATIASVIATGASLLLLPAATTGGISGVDAFFLSTSATCVTGLATIDMGTSFTFFGQLVILLLIQVGGLGLMSFVAFFALFLGHSVGLGESVSISRALDSEFLNDLRRILASIVAWTFTIEITGALILYNTWRPMMSGSSSLHVLWQSIFHSISAFCNAGLSINSANLEGFVRSPATCFTVGGLIVFGGLGFGTLTALGSWLANSMRGVRGATPPVQARLALLVTAILIAASMALFAAVEWNRSLAGLTGVERISNSFLEAVTPRTAGFDTIPTLSLQPLTVWAFVFLMFVGASPGGTGGGVKTTTLGLFAIAAASLFRQRPAPEVWRRRIPLFDLHRAAVLVFLAAGVCIISTSILMLTEGAMLAADRRTVFDYLFEVVSAFGTVGLSMGVTAELTTAGRWVIILTMFLGRVGPATLAAVSARPRALRYTYPEARIGIG
jgi:trk system potassium uptake protein TrkH